MQLKTHGLLKAYKKRGWTVCETVLSGEPMLPKSLKSETPLIVPVKWGLDLSPAQMRGLLGFGEDDQIVSIHSGVLGNGVAGEVATAVGRKFREAGIIICNG